MDPASARERAQRHLSTSAEVARSIAEVCADTIVAGASRIAESLRGGGKILLCGNGGSAAEAQHIAAEFVGRLHKEIERPAWAALALTTDTSFLTSHANDRGFHSIFERQIEALGRPGDVLVAISTSGDSENVIRAVHACKPRGIATLGLSGGSGGRLRRLVDLAIVVPHTSTYHVQEGHCVIGHLLADLAEQMLLEVG